MSPRVSNIFPSLERDDETFRKKKKKGKQKKKKGKENHDKVYFVYEKLNFFKIFFRKAKQRVCFRMSASHLFFERTE